MGARRRRPVEPVEPLEPVRRRIPARERMLLMEERDAALLALPVADHRAFLRQFYDAHPGWPIMFVSDDCRCARCIAAGTAG